MKETNETIVSYLAEARWIVEFSFLTNALIKPMIFVDNIEVSYSLN